MELPPLPEGSRLRVEEETDAVWISYPVFGGPLLRLLLIGLFCLETAAWILVIYWSAEVSRRMLSLSIPGAGTHVLREGLFILSTSVLIFPAFLLMLANLVRSSGNAELLLKPDAAILDPGRGNMIASLKPGWLRSVRVSPTGRIRIRGRWAVWPLRAASFSLLPFAFRPPTLQDALWIEQVLKKWREEALFP